MADPKDPSTLSPCIGVCTIEPTTRMCRGCLRTMDEIAAWASLDRPARKEVLKRVGERRRARKASPVGVAGNGR